MLLPAFSGCAWRTDRADHVLGPAFYRFKHSASGRVVAVQSVHAPLLLEGGRQWGVSVGAMQRLALVPERRIQDTEGRQVSAPLRLLWNRPQPGRWQFSLLYSRIPLGQSPVFLQRRSLGITASIGAEERALSLGYSSFTAMNPREEALYIFDFQSRRPLNATFELVPAASLESAKPTNKEPADDHP